MIFCYKFNEECQLFIQVILMFVYQRILIIFVKDETNILILFELLWVKFYVMHPWLFTQPVFLKEFMIEKSEKIKVSMLNFSRHSLDFIRHSTAKWASSKKLRLKI
jgi:hypothetical protein